MKKLMLPLFAAALVFSATSCKKSYTCECNNTYSLDGNVLYSTNTTETFRTTKNDARDRCSSVTNSYTFNAGALIGIDTFIVGQEQRNCSLR